MMTNNNDANLNLVQTELRFILTQATTGGVESAQLIQMAAESALQALFEHSLSLEPASDPDAEFDYPAPPEGGPVLVGSATFGRERVGAFVI
ncbi:MAG TPA: hypothetical protein VF240_22390 [Pyrinomonadaceae bacterium]